MLKLTEEGQSSLDDLTEIRRVFQEVSRYEFLMGEKHYSAVQDAFFAAMRNFESELIEEIYNANDLEFWASRIKEMPKKFSGEKMRELRKSKGIAQNTMARELGMLQSLLSQYENDRRSPRKKNATLIAAYLGVDLDYFYVPSITAENTKGEEDANYLEVWRCDPIGEQGSDAGEVH